MKKLRPVRWLASVITAASLVLSGCGSMQDVLDSIIDKQANIKPGTTISSDSKWINSDIIGAIDEDTAVRVQDDFYTAVNRDNILSADTSKYEDGKPIGTFYTDAYALRERLKNLINISPDNTDGLDESVMSADELCHVQELVKAFYDKAADLSERNSEGAEPLRPYIEYINSISSMEELTEYLGDIGGANVSGISLLPITISRPQSLDDEEKYAVLVSAAAPLSLNDDASNYSSLLLSSKELSEDMVFYTLEGLGYSRTDIRAILSSCYRFEIKLSRHIPSVSETSGKSDREEINTAKQYKSCNLEELVELSGNYPIESLLKAAGLETSDYFLVEEPDQVKNVSSIYTANNLEDIKSYLLVQLIRANSELLDEELFNKAQELKTKENQVSLSSDKADDDKSDDADNASDTGSGLSSVESDDVILTTYINKYLNDAYEEIYIGHYCDLKTKEELKRLTKAMAQGFREVLLNADWMSEETKAKALDKLDNMQMNVLYPDQLTDFSALSFDSCSSLTELTGRINSFRYKQLKKYINQPLSEYAWDLNTTPTTTPNAFNLIINNSIYICAGFLCTNDIFDANAADEYNYARMGAIIGHEISHGFDTTGYSYNRIGLEDNWWTSLDRESFDIRSRELIKYYDALSPIPGADGTCNGEKLSGEAIADMGGIRAALYAAKEKPDFDYKEFFENYAKLWFILQDYHSECMDFLQDEHPLHFLRVDVTLQQFDEFKDTFGIAPGDGMYIDDNQKITVW